MSDDKTIAGYEGATCENCFYCKEVHCVPIKSREPVKIKHLCKRDSAGNGFEVYSKEFCDFFTPKDDKTIVSAINFRGRKIELAEPIEVPKKVIRNATLAADGVYIPPEVNDFFAYIIEALNDKIKEKKDES